MNRNYFCRFFKEKVGKTPFSYLNEYRVNQAASQLLSTRLPITEIALNAGFENMSYFIRQFRRCKGCTLPPTGIPKTQSLCRFRSDILYLFSVRQPPVFVRVTHWNTITNSTPLTMEVDDSAHQIPFSPSEVPPRMIASGIRALVKIMLITLHRCVLPSPESAPTVVVSIHKRLR